MTLIEVLQRATPCFPQCPKRETLVKNQTIIVLVFKIHNFVERGDGSKILVQSLNYNESSQRIWLSTQLKISLVKTIQNSLQIFHIVVLEPVYVCSAQVNPSHKWFIDTFIYNQDVTALCKCGYSAGARGSAIRIHDSPICFHEFADCIFKLQMLVDGAVETTRTARTTTVLDQCFYRGILQERRCLETEKIEIAEVHDLRFRPWIV
mmetsp:Transcript_19198/g.47455  ORF Transcript_19198/g.47455 Transcript_19198/m.47455 type:complete len:207 (-) Transcript_19198:435-1055(-)